MPTPQISQQVPANTEYETGLHYPKYQLHERRRDYAGDETLHSDISHAPQVMRIEGKFATERLWRMMLAQRAGAVARSLG
jgi:hypothetical protein